MLSSSCCLLQCLVFLYHIQLSSFAAGTQRKPVLLLAMQVHRHHADEPDPLVYGRTMTNEPELTEGAAVHMLAGPSPIISVVTYE